MARPPEITDEDIVAAGQQLERAGERIGAYRLYRAVGGRGRPDRLLAVWTAHVAGRGSAEVQEPPALPPAIRDGLAAAMRMIGEQLERTFGQVSADLAAEAAARTAAERDALARERANIAEEAADALAEFTRLAEDVERLRGETQRLEEDLRRAEIARGAAETVRQLAVEQLTAAHAERTEALLEVARATERTAAAERRITVLETDLAALRAGTKGEASSGTAGKSIQVAAPTDGAGGHVTRGTRRGPSGTAQRKPTTRRRGRRTTAADVAAPADAITATGLG